MKTYTRFWSFLAQFFLKNRNVSDQICRGIQNTHFMLNNIFYNRVVYGICEKKEQPDRPQMTIWRMRTACWIPSATIKHSDYVILTAFPLQQLLHERNCLVTECQATALKCTSQAVQIRPFNPLRTERDPPNGRKHFVPCSKHSPPRL